MGLRMGIYEDVISVLHDVKGLIKMVQRSRRRQRKHKMKEVQQLTDDKAEKPRSTRYLTKKKDVADISRFFKKVKSRSQNVYTTEALETKEQMESYLKSKSKRLRTDDLKFDKIKSFLADKEHRPRIQKFLEKNQYLIEGDLNQKILLEKLGRLAKAQKYRRMTNKEKEIPTGQVAKTEDVVSITKRITSIISSIDQASYERLQAHMFFYWYYKKLKCVNYNIARKYLEDLLELNSINQNSTLNILNCSQLCRYISSIIRQSNSTLNDCEMIMNITFKVLDHIHSFAVKCLPYLHSVQKRLNVGQVEEIAHQAIIFVRKLLQQIANEQLRSKDKSKIILKTSKSLPFIVTIDETSSKNNFHNSNGNDTDQPSDFIIYHPLQFDNASSIKYYGEITIIPIDTFSNNSIFKRCKISDHPMKTDVLEQYLKQVLSYYQSSLHAIDHAAYGHALNEMNIDSKASVVNRANLESSGQSYKSTQPAYSSSEFITRDEDYKEHLDDLQLQNSFLFDVNTLDDLRNVLSYENYSKQREANKLSTHSLYKSIDGTATAKNNATDKDSSDLTDANTTNNDFAHLWQFACDKLVDYELTLNDDSSSRSYENIDGESIISTDSMLSDEYQLEEFYGEFQEIENDLPLLSSKEITNPSSKAEVLYQLDHRLRRTPSQQSVSNYQRLFNPPFNYEIKNTLDNKQMKILQSSYSWQIINRRKQDLDILVERCRNAKGDDLTVDYVECYENTSHEVTSDQIDSFDCQRLFGANGAICYHWTECLDFSLPNKFVNCAHIESAAIEITEKLWNVYDLRRYHVILPILEINIFTYQEAEKQIYQFENKEFADALYNWKRSNKIRIKGEQSENMSETKDNGQ
ncbi:hypothetical protein GJ496_008147, partial [Pomphorhynchus laevis]